MIIFPKDRQVLIDNEKELPEIPMLKLDDDRMTVYIPKYFNVIFLLKK